VTSTRPYRPQTNGKTERFHRTMVEGWGFKKFDNSESARLLLCQPGSTNRTTTGLTRPSAKSPITRLNNLGITSRLDDTLTAAGRGVVPRVLATPVAEWASRAWANSNPEARTLGNIQRTGVTGGWSRSRSPMSGGPAMLSYGTPRLNAVASSRRA
jgi:hypothetical protein